MNDSAPPTGRISPRVRAVLVLVAVCAFGVVAGVALDRSCLRRHAAFDGFYRDRPPYSARSEGERREHWNRLAKRLQLTPMQSVAIDSILAQQGRQLRDSRKEFEPRMWSIMKMTRERIDSTLTPDQRALLQKLRQEREMKRDRR